MGMENERVGKGRKEHTLRAGTIASYKLAVNIF